MWGAEKSLWWMWRLDSTCRKETEMNEQGVNLRDWQGDRESEINIWDRIRVWVRTKLEKEKQREWWGRLERGREGQSCCCCWWNVDCVCLFSPVASSPHTRTHTQIMTSFLFSFAETLSSTPLYSSSPLSVPPSLAPLLFSNSPSSLSKSQRSHLHPNRQEIHTKEEM